MELDDLRRQWQQPPADTPAPLDAAALTQLLTRQSDGIVEWLRRSARLELYINFGLVLGSLALAWLAPLFWVRVFGWVLVVIGIVCIGYLYRKLRLLRHLDNASGDLRGHLRRLVDGLRVLTRFYYRFTLAMLPVAGVVNVLMMVSTFEIRLATWLGLATTVGCVVLLPALMYLPVANVTHRYLQHMYGQHVDRLEASLRELAEPEPAAAG